MIKKKKLKINKSAVFLDRDGVLIRDVDHLSREDQLRLLPGAVKALGRLNRAGWLAVIISNQAAVAKGMLAEAEMYRIGEVLNSRIIKRGARLDAVYYCPHHPEGKVLEYVCKCKCRKPEPGLILKAAKEMSIDLKRSYLVGDKTGDILAGEKAGIKTILVETGYGGGDGKYPMRPDYVTKNLMGAVKIILKSQDV